VALLRNLANLAFNTVGDIAPADAGANRRNPPDEALRTRTLLILGRAESIGGCVFLAHVSAVLRGAVILVPGKVIDF
jgi:hypothetical protein